MKRNLTCIICPMGCSIDVEITDGKVIGIKGNTCKRGAEYAKTECTNPMRTVTTTVRCENGTVIPVKTDRMIPKEKIMECMNIINSTVARLPIASGDIIAENVCGSNIIATRSAQRENCCTARSEVNG